ncbi:MAG TPA: hypothetical protein VJV78_41530 [Polyangiales bacterium]|nr:hypothetical protein [Polyangiales bacterium]
MSENILELWERESFREAEKQPVSRTFRERVRTLRQAAARRIDDWIGELDDAQTRPDRDF